MSILREGGNAIEAMIAAAATIAVVYPHMNGLGGDGFWLIHQPGAAPIGIDACGRTGGGVTPDLYPDRAMPSRGPLAANTVAGTVSGWSAALRLAKAAGGRLPLSRLLAEAAEHAARGVPVTASQSTLSRRKWAELAEISGFRSAFAPAGVPPETGDVVANPALAETLRQLGRAGADDFYVGDIAGAIAGDLARAGSPIGLSDLNAQSASLVRPLMTRAFDTDLFNMPPPTQGVSSLMILALVDRLGWNGSEAERIHKAVTATRHAFAFRDAAVGDPSTMGVSASDALESVHLDGLADRIRRGEGPSAETPGIPGGDTVWLGVADSDGRVVSFIQSLYWEFGSGVVLPSTGIVWQNRGIGFSLDQNAPVSRRLAPWRKPFHTLNPALARFCDGRVMAYGTMGGEGQPQTQAAMFLRHVVEGQPLQQAINQPRWLHGRTWGDENPGLKMESRFDSATVDALAALGHEVSIVGDFDSLMGHAGAVTAIPGGVQEGASDPRSDGAALG